MEVILVNEHDEALGSMEKMEAHEKGLLHRAFSVFIFNNRGEWLLQQRADGKYHSPGLWTNTCCSHPQPGETIAEAAIRRLQEEMGFVTELEKRFHFTYKADFDNGLTEYEFDHVLTGVYNGPILPDPAEVKDYRFVSQETLQSQLEAAPHQFTAWFKIAYPRMEEYLALRNES
ncbi:MAG TPA: isopentenyl-diphosphate Delta-isomerase [Ferruginibacter sp.]|nr:isopentenyl-diphosphate Delta-isomerase [Ferruginibacter sp.]